MIKLPSWCYRSHKSWALLILRLVAGVIFVYHGYGKLFGDAPGMEKFIGMVAGLGFPLPTFFAYSAALSEFVGGILLILGLFTRVASIFTAIVMVVALVGVKQFALPKADPDYTLLAMSLALLLMGAGRYSLDAILCKKSCCGHKGDCGCGCCGDKKMKQGCQCGNGQCACSR